MFARPAASLAWPLLLVGQRHVRTRPCANKNGLASASSSFFSSFSDNPYRVLNVPVNSNYDTVKTAFLKAALQHHPDHSKQADTAAFIRIRQAFEEIVSQTSATSTETYGTATSPVVQTWKSDAEFQAWFRQATGEFLAFDMNHDTRQEVIRAYRTMSAGGKDKGGYWEMARQLAEREDAVQGQTAVHSSSSASIKSSSISSTSRAEKPECPSSNLRRKRNR
jgi:DnaJ-class molecular chaperone